MLTIDIGNSSIKWALWRQHEMVASGRCSYLKAQVQQAFACWQSLSPQKQVIVACVAGADVEHAVTAWMRQHWSVAPIFLRSTEKLGDVINAYTDPSQFGVDRWAALLGARALTDQPVCIIDAGTAITVDLMDARGRHLGGLIMPGLEMMRAALVQRAAGIHQTDGKLSAFANNTADAVSSGTLLMVRAAIVDICASAAEHLGNDMTIIITGGLSKTILSLLGLPKMWHQPDLVLQGLHWAARIQAAEG